MLHTLTQDLTAGRSLGDEQIADAVAALLNEEVSAPVKAAFLTALAGKGETAAEITGFARELRGRALQPPLDPQTRARQILDVCGTGGDKLNTFNISTTVALVAAAADVTVAKHGNRAITSHAGSADVLEALGIRVDLPPEAAAHSLRDHGFAFFFAQMYHPAFKHMGPARRLCAEKGQRTIFNFLGPLLNPVHPTAQLIGVPDPKLCEPMALALQGLGCRRGMVVSGKVEIESGASGWLDELSILGENHVAEFYHEHGFHRSVMELDHFPLQPAKLADLTGGSATDNAKIVRLILEGREKGPKRDAVLLNGAAALFVAGRSDDLIAGWSLAKETIDSGKAAAKLNALVAAA